MPVVRFIQHFTRVPDTWEGWAMRVLTIAVVLMLGTACILLEQTAALREQVIQGRNERNAYQIQQTARVCTILRHVDSDPNVLRDAQC